MAVNEQAVEQIVKQILSQMGGQTVSSSASNTSGAIPSKVRIAFLSEIGKMEIKVEMMTSLLKLKDAVSVVQTFTNIRETHFHLYRLL